MKENIKEPILYVDDEIENLDGFRYTFMLDYDISVAKSAKEGLKLLEQKEFKLVITDQKMPEISGVEFLKIVKDKFPDTIRIVLTAYADATNAIEAINNGEIYRYLSKPWEKTDLKATIENAIETYNLKHKNKELIVNLKDTNHELSQTNTQLNEKIIELEETYEKLRKQNEEYATLNEEYKTQNSELLITKEKIEESQKRYKNLYNNTPVMMQSSDLEGNILSVNEYWLSTLGYAMNEVIGTKASDYLTEKSKIQYADLVKGFLIKGIINNVEIKALKKDGSILVLLVSSKILYNTKAEPLYTMTNLVDITLIKEAEKIQKILSKELIEAKEKAEESDRLKTEFINNMSHEIRTPMNGIIGFSEILNTPNLSEKKRKNYINIIKNSGEQLLRIIDDILEISRLGTKQVKTIDTKVCLNDLLLELFSIFDKKAKENKTPLYLKKGLSDKESMIYIDKTKLNTILSNLLENALKFTRSGYIEFGYTIARGQHAPLSLQIYVKDTGVGIKQDKHKIIFERFSQEEKEISQKVGGLGLGLSIAKENTELLGGKITLKSEKDNGTTFFVTIPFKPVHSEQETINQKSETINQNQETDSKKQEYLILIAEDEEINTLFIDLLLEKSKHNIKTIHAIDGKEAVEICKNNPKINLVLMDIKLPILDGYEATKLIKEFRPNLPIIAQTAHSTKEFKNKAISAGCDDFITKPINPKQLHKMVNDNLKSN